MQTRGRSLSTIATVRKPVVLVLAESYLPGYKAGGPVRSISNVVEALGNEVDFRLVTCNRDMGESEPYPGIEPYTWIQVGKAQVIYIPKGPRSLWKFVAILRSTPADLLYLNSFFARRYSILPSILQRMGLLHLGSVVLAPRGEFSAGAVQLKARRKLAYLTIAKRVGLYHGIVWHASSQYEELDIKRVFRDTESIAVA